MNITAKEARRQLKKDNQGLEHVWFKDPEYDLWGIDDAKLFVNFCSVANIPFIPFIWECDNYSLELLARIRKIQRDLVVMGNKKNQRKVCFFAVTGFENSVGVHDTNGLITHDAGIQYFDPQDNEFKPTYNGNIFLIEG